MLTTLIPLFDGTTTVRAYSLFTQKDNFLLNPSHLGTGRFDGLARVDGLDLVKSMGLATLSDDKEVFVEVNNVSVFSDIESQCPEGREKVVLLFDTSITPDENYISRIAVLKRAGFRLAIRKITIPQFDSYNPIIRLMDYAFLDHKKVNIRNARTILSKLYSNLRLVAVNVNSQEDYDMLVAQGGFDLYEGEFFRMPAVKSQKDIAPVKINYIELLNVVNEPNYELTDAADVISRDPALIISLLKMVNRMSLNSEITSIRHAAAMLGQKELKKWISTAVTRELCADRPGEITRVSLLRAKFAENLAPAFGLGGFSSEIFLMGLFSVIDVILEKPMEEALSLVKLPINVNKALLKGEGEYVEILDFIKQYENASWQEVSRQLLLKNISTGAVYDAYAGALEWYKQLFSEEQ